MKIQISRNRLNKYSVVFGLLIVFIFLEIIIISPNILETANDDFDESNVVAGGVELQNQKAVEQKMRGVHLVEKGWQLFANEAVGTIDAQWILKEVQLHFFNDKLISYVVKGDVGEIDGTTKNMIIKGNVITTSANGYTFKTDTLSYISAQNIMTSLDPVEMLGPPDRNGLGFRLTGEKLLVDISKNQMSILDKVKTNKKINGKKFDLTSVRANFNNQNQEANFTGDVKMKMEQLNVSAPEAYFYYSANSQLFEKIILNKGVTFFESERRGSSENLEMDLLENKMTMRGQPKVQQGRDEIQGHEIVFVDGGKRVKINKSRN